MKKILNKRNIVLASVLILVASLVLIFTMAIPIGPVDIDNITFYETFTPEDFEVNNFIETDSTHIKLDFSDEHSANRTYDHVQISVSSFVTVSEDWVDVNFTLVYTTYPYADRLPLHGTLRIHNPVSVLEICCTPGNDSIEVHATSGIDLVKCYLDDGQDIFYGFGNIRYTVHTWNYTGGLCFDCITTADRVDKIYIDRHPDSNSWVRGAFVDSRGGNDRIRVSDRIIGPVVIYAGDGNDYVRGSASTQEIIVGGSGIDDINGNGGGDIIKE